MGTTSAFQILNYSLESIAFASQVLNFIFDRFIYNVLVCAWSPSVRRICGENMR